MAGAEQVDVLWLVVATILVLIMQAGFLCLEHGFVRAKNGVNVAVKNVVDFCLSAVLFWAIGFGLMFGTSSLGLVGGSGFLFDGGDASVMPPGHWMAFFFFNLAFCSTATTIVSGAVAERMTIAGYLAGAAILSGLLYPLYGHWAWGGAAEGLKEGWLGALGFIDFAGSTVVHSVGGWVALAALVVLGPRLGRFGPEGRPIQGHNIAIAGLGALLLWVGWFGFNGGSTLRFDATVASILVNTLLAGAAGGLAAMAESWVRLGRPDVTAIINGSLAGLVAITAPCAVVGAGSAVLIGALGGVIATGAAYLLLRLRIDDAVGAVPVHLAAGIWGTLAVGLLGDPALWGTGLSRLEQVGVQALGVAVAGLFAFPAALVLLRFVDIFMPLRVRPDEEAMGLNVSEHGASNALQDLLEHMTRQRDSGDFSRPASIEPGTEAGVFAEGYNLVLSRFHEEVARREAVAASLREAKEAAEIASASKSQFLANMSHELRTPLNAIIGFSEVMREETFGPIGNGRYKEYLGDIHRSSTHLLSLISDILDLSKIEANKLELAEEVQVNLAIVIENALRVIARRAREERVRLAVDIDPALPALTADPRALKQILLNLLTNAIKFTPAQGSVTVEARLEPDGRVAVAVADTGLGMRREDIPRALEPFTQLNIDARRTAAEGAGLGLPITVALVRLHGGTVVVESAPGEGTRVTVRFPESRVRRPETALPAVAQRI